MNPIAKLTIRSEIAIGNQAMAREITIEVEESTEGDCADAATAIAQIGRILDDLTKGIEWKKIEPGAAQ